VTDPPSSAKHTRSSPEASFCFENWGVVGPGF